MSTAANTKPLAEDRDASDTAPAAPFGHGRARRSRLVVVAVLVFGLILSSFGRHLALGLQSDEYQRGPYGNAVGGGSSGNGQAVAASLGNLDSYFLVLMLGGLRGPLVMYLWSSSENQKNERDLEDFNTKIHLIGLLQPEFSSVYIFQSWNLAFNISVQLTSRPDRYAVILDAIDFLKQGDAARPNDVNMLLQFNQMYGQKLGKTVGDSDYYRERAREESMWHAAASSGGMGTRSQHLESMLDKQFNILPQLGTPLQPRPADLPTTILLPVRRVDEFKQAAAAVGVVLPANELVPASGDLQLVVKLPEAEAKKLAAVYYPIDLRYIYADWNDGSEFQYLKQYDPFPYGVSPLAIAYCYGKRAQVLVHRTKQQPSQVSLSVVDSRPGLELREWAREERDRAVLAEQRLYGRQAYPSNFLKWLTVAPEDPRGPAEVDVVSLVHRFLADPNQPAPGRPRDAKYDEDAATKSINAAATAIAPATTLSGADLDEALFEYGRAALLMRDARAEYARHMSQPIAEIRQLQDFSSHIDELTVAQLLCEADHDFLLAYSPDEGRAHAPLPGQPKLVGRQALLERAATEYRQSISWNRVLNLRYYMPAEITRKIAQRMKPAEIEELPWHSDQIDAIYGYVLRQIELNPALDQNQPDRAEGTPNESRAQQRLALIQRMLGQPATGPASQPATGPASQPAVIPTTLPVAAATR